MRNNFLSMASLRINSFVNFSGIVVAERILMKHNWYCATAY